MNKYFYKNIHQYLSILLLLIFLFIHANAQATNCTRASALKADPWTQLSSGPNFSNNQILYRTTAKTTYTLRASSIEWHMDVLIQGPYSSAIKYDAIPLADTPGVGIRVKWQAITVPYASITHQLPNGSILSRNGVIDAFHAESSMNFSPTFHYVYEIVITDASKYKGGKISLTSLDSINAIVKTEISQCHDGFANLLSVVTTAPELPQPAVPTCTSASLTQTVKMPAINRSQLAAPGSPKGNGAIGETGIDLYGINCSKDTVIKAYFTDNNDASSTKTHLKSSNATVGIRIYYLINNGEVTFGPAPKGSSMPLHPPIQSIIIPSSTSNVYMPFSAQYVRLPGVQAEHVQGGPVKASATVTFVYE